MNLRELIRKPFTHTVFASPVDLTGKQFIVTGASPGSLGYETAKTLAEWGALVAISTRNNTPAVVEQMKGELQSATSEANGFGAIVGQNLDLSDTASVTRFSQWYGEHHGARLDGLINNAGVHLDLLSKWKQPNLLQDGYEIHWRTNYLGTAQLTQALLPLLLATADSTGDARVVNVVSQLHSLGRNEALLTTDNESGDSYSSWKAYGLSKLALIHMTHELHRQYNSQGLNSFSLHPGSTSGTYTHVAERGLEGSSILLSIRKVTAPLEQLFMSTAKEGAQTQIYCATSVDAISGRYYRDCAATEASDAAGDGDVAARLWKTTQDWYQQVTAS